MYDMYRYMNLYQECVYTKNIDACITIDGKEAMNFKKSGKGYMGAFGEKKEEKKCN